VAGRPGPEELLRVGESAGSPAPEGCGAGGYAQPRRRQALATRSMAIMYAASRM
jgi:hypothetical protein